MAIFLMLHVLENTLFFLSGSLTVHSYENTKEKCSLIIQQTLNKDDTSLRKTTRPTVLSKAVSTIWKTLINM